MKACSRCKVEKELGLFNNSQKGTHGRHAYCRQCCSDLEKLRPSRKEEHRTRQNHRRRILDIIKTMASCADCQYDSHPAALDFDHLPEFVKSFDIARETGRSWDLMFAEIMKCEVVCSNCHRIRTADRRVEEGSAYELV